jgi:hypothetical protein
MTKNCKILQVEKKKYFLKQKSQYMYPKLQSTVGVDFIFNFPYQLEELIFYKIGYPSDLIYRTFTVYIYREVGVL